MKRLYLVLISIDDIVVNSSDKLYSYNEVFMFSTGTLAETFTSLSDDSQRLFVRLYTRKG